LLIEKVEVKFGVESALPVLHLRPAARHTIEAFCFAVEVEVTTTYQL
jgi:hypothetical protein